MDRDQSKTPSVCFADTVSRGRNRASVRECPEQWGIPKFASGKEPTGLFARKHLLTPYTGEAIMRNLPQNNFCKQNHAFAQQDSICAYLHLNLAERFLRQQKDFRETLTLYK